jgi:hypothetical protein
MIFFRLNGSKKVSTVYCTDLNISAKTLRRRWFQRTQIEQFFRMMKDTLKIQHSKSTDKDTFTKKLVTFLFKATFAYRFRNFARKHKGLKKVAFSKLIFFFVNYNVDSKYLDNQFILNIRHKLLINKLLWIYFSLKIQTKLRVLHDL